MTARKKVTKVPCGIYREKDQQSSLPMAGRLLDYVLRDKAGGKRIKPGSRTSLVLHEAICDGVSIASVDMLKNDLDMNDGELAEALGMSTSTILRTRKNRKRFDIVASDRFYRYAKLFAIAVEVFEDEKNACSWLRRPQFGLGGKIPLELMKTEPGACTVENLLMRIEHSVLV